MVTPKITYEARGQHKLSVIKNDTGYYLVLPATELSFSYVKDLQRDYDFDMTFVEDSSGIFESLFDFHFHVPDGYVLELDPYDCDDYFIFPKRSIFFTSETPSLLNDDMLVFTFDKAFKRSFLNCEEDIILFKINIYNKINDKDVDIGPSLWTVM